MSISYTSSTEVRRKPASCNRVFIALSGELTLAGLAELVGLVELGRLLEQVGLVELSEF